MYQSLLDKLETLRKHTARFRRVAVHLHSPDSHDWGKSGDEERNRKERFHTDDGLAAFEKELAEHLDFACITDHMRCSFATQLSSASTRLTVLPGMEVNLQIEPPIGFTRIHVLSILPLGSTPEDFSCLFADTNIPRNDGSRTGHEVVTGCTLKKWVDKVHAEDGICIAAHVDNNSGVRLVFRQAAKDILKLFHETDETGPEFEKEVPNTLKEYLFDSGIDAVEVHRGDLAQHYKWTSPTDGRLRSIATLLTFDAHCCEAFARNDRISYVKMTTADLKGLKSALRFPDTRIRFPCNLPATPNPRLLGISITGTDESFFDDVTIALAENLNCIIGVRGSGKSTVIEALRYVFGYNRSLSDLGSMADGIRDMQLANLKGTTIRIAYRSKSGEDRILQASFDEKSDYSTKCYAVTGDHLEILDVETCGHFPLRLFGWSELETLGRVPTKQRDLLDRLIPELTSAFQRRDSIRQELNINRGRIAQCLTNLRAAFEQNDSHITRFREFTSDFDKLNTPEVRELFAALDFSKSKRRILAQIESNTSECIRQIEDLTSISLRTNIDDLLAQGSDALREWWLNSELQSLGVVAVEVESSGLSRQIVERILAFRAVLQSRLSALDQEIANLEQDLQQRLDQEGNNAMQRIADLRANAEKRLRAVAEIRRRYLMLWQELAQLLKERNDICDQLSRIQLEIAGIRTTHNTAVEKTLNRFLPDWMTVAIDFRPGQDKEQYREKLKAVVPGRANTLSVAHVRKALEDHYNPVSCAMMVLQSDYDGLAGKESRIAEKTFALTTDDVEYWSSRINPFEHHEGADVLVLAEDGSRLATILDLQETPWDDFATILLDGGPVNEKSPGQRASAMLPLIALAEETPLVIDQPEDNLDKRLIGTVLMQVLAELKEKRQITVCTHDPNILVGGDAEQVIVLKAESNRRGVVEAHGSIDDERIVQTVIDLLEGGREAFEARQRRYGLDGENADDPFPA